MRREQRISILQEPIKVVDRTFQEVELKEIIAEIQKLSE